MRYLAGVEYLRKNCRWITAIGIDFGVVGVGAPKPRTLLAVTHPKSSSAIPFVCRFSDERMYNRIQNCAVRTNNLAR